MLGTIATSYAITYVVGLLGIIATVRLLPRLVGVDLAAEAAKMEEADKEERARSAAGARLPRDECRAV